MPGKIRNSLLAALLGLVGCASVAGEPERTGIPYDAPYDMRSRLVAVCYSAHVSTKAQVSKAAAELCKEPDTPVELWRDDIVQNDCPFFKKRRAVFTCNYPKK